MPDYSKGKIYYIRSPHTDEVYIGSTIQSLAKRMGEHRTKFHEWKRGTYHYFTCFKLFELGDAYIELVEEFPCENKNQLEKREGEIMRNTEMCINKYIAGRTKKEHYIEYRDEHLERSKNYRDINKDDISQQRKQYYQKNIDYFKVKNREYRENNHEQIRIKKIEYYHKTKHIQSEVRKEYLKKYYQENKERQNELRRLRLNKNKEKINLLIL